jgi:lambda family phage tail tape measure protein
MAESVARVKILAQIEGLEGFDKLKGAFRGLQQAIGPAESELAKARKQILAFGEAGAKSEQVIKGQVEALKALQSQATIGSNVYRQLGKDVKTLGGAYKEAATGVKEFTDAQLKSQIVGAKPSTFGKQVAALKRDLQDLSVYSQQYTDKLTEIQRRQLPFDTALGRQGVIAAAETYSQGGKGGSALPMMPDTTAALRQRMGELNAELANVARGGEAWIRVSREMAAVQRELNREFANPAVEAARRRLEQSRNTTSGFLQFSTGLEDRIAIDKSIARNQRKKEAEAAARSGPMQGPPAPSELFQNIAGISNQTASNQLQLMGRSYREVADSIRQTAGASDGSLGSLQRQRAAWEQLRATISPLDKEYAQIEREARRAIAAADKQIGRRQIGGRGGSAQIGQGAGALAASGIFGGPEGFLGSALGGGIGALVGGPAGFATGTFLGGSVGAYAGMGRQAVGGFATYAADISKLEIALKGVTKTQEEYQRALAASASVTRDFNVPQLEATRGMTQLSAAVIGAGGKVADAEVVFRNVTAAIKASGGSAEDVQGALTALSQVFSKGKVSAEELQGQLGERLPGAVTMFAKATGRTLPQLQKDLEQGVVGLADLMKFVVSDQGLGQFEQRAKQVASSSADAGARLTATWNDTKRAIGEAILPLGAQIQDSLGKALKEATPALVEFAKGLAGFVKFLVDNGPLIGGLAKFALQMGAVTLAIKGFIALQPGIIATFAAFQLGGAKAAASAALAAPKVLALGRALKALSLIGVITIGIELAVKGLSDYNKLKGEIEALRGYDPSKTFAGATRETVSGAVKQAKADLAKFQKELKALQGREWQTLIPGSQLWGASAGDFYKDRKQLEVRIARAQKTISSLDPLKFRSEVDIEKENLRKLQEQLTDFSDPTKGDLDTKALDRLRKEQESLDAEQQRFAEANAQAQIRLAEAVFRAQTDLDRKRFELQQELINRERDLRIASLTGVAAETASQTAQFFRTIDELRQRTRQAAIDAAGSQRTLQNASFMSSVTRSSAGGGSFSGGARTSRRRDPDAEATGWDIVMPGGRGAPVRAPIDLTITGTGFQGSGAGSSGRGYGNWITGEFKLGGKTYELLLGHFDKINVAKGMQVPAGASLGSQGITGRTFGTHATTHVNPKGGASVGDAWGALESLTRAWETGKPIGKSPTGVAAQQRRNVADQGDVAIAQVDFDMAVEYKALLEEMVQKRLPQEVQLFALEGAKAYKDQAQALRDNVGELQKRQELENAGARQEVIDSELKKSQLTRDYTKQIEQLNDDLKQKEVLEDTTGVKAEGIRARIAAITQGYADQKAALDELTAAQIAFNDAQRFGQDNRIGMGMKEGVQSYVESIGTMREATAQLAQVGIQGLEDQLFSLATTGKANFREFAAEILKQTTRMIIQQLILRVIMQAIGGIGGGGGGLGSVESNLAKYAPLSGGYAMGGAFAKNNVIPFAMGGIVDKPTLFKFANGGAMATGVMGEAGPEAIMPLKRGRDGKLGIAGGGGGSVTVNVSVDASGSKVQGDSGKGEQLGRAVSQAVQEELLRQKRPGGLLAA